MKNKILSIMAVAYLLPSFMALWLLWAPTASAGVSCTLPFNLQNNTTADATQVMANYNALVTCLGNAAAAGSNNDITALLGLTTPLAPAEGGTSVFIGGAATNASNVYSFTTTLPTSGFALTKGYIVSFTAPSANTAATQLNVAGTGATNFFRQTQTGPSAMLGGEIQPNQVIVAYYDGTQFQCVNCQASAGIQTGTVLDYAGVTAPAGYLLTNGAAVSRTTFANLFAALAVPAVAATTTNTSTSVAVPNSALFQVGWYVGATANITCNAFITAIPDGTHITISSAATGSGSPTLTIGPYQQGDCSTTFNVPNYNGKVLAGVDGTTNITTATIPLISTFTNASAVIAAPNNFVAGQALTFTTTGSLPTNFATLTTYYVISTGLSATQFEVSATPGGSAITAGSAGTGVQSAQVATCPNAASIGDKSAAPNLGCGAQSAIQSQAMLPNVTLSMTSTNTNIPVNASSPTSVTAGGAATPLFGNTVTNLTSTGPLNGGVTQTGTPILTPTSLVQKIIKT